tara:strand:+ start:2421 stop:2867 length:447 start_codon:yes stop_codon:yes gene_type:complete
MRLPFKSNEETIDEYLSVVKELCIIQHEDTWYKDKSHAVLYPDLEDAKSKVGKPHYWILNAIDEYDESEEKESSLINLAQIIFNTNYYSEKLTADTENLEAKIELSQFLSNLEIDVSTIADHMTSMDVPKYVRIEDDDATTLISSWLK